MESISFIGLGNMGIGMAANLLDAGFSLVLWNRTPARGEPLAARGARIASSVADAAGSGVVITMVADDRALEDIVWRDGLLETMPKGSVHVSMSTISVALSERLAVAHAEHGSGFVAAPVFGRPEAAAGKKLFIVAAGAAALLERCRPAFDAMGQRTFHVGDQPSKANVVKISGNFLIVSVIETLGEAIALVRKSGVDPQQYVDLLTSTVFTAPLYKTYGDLIAARRYRPAGFRLPLALQRSE